MQICVYQFYTLNIKKIEVMGYMQIATYSLEQYNRTSATCRCMKISTNYPPFFLLTINKRKKIAIIPDHWL